MKVSLHVASFDWDSPASIAPKLTAAAVLAEDGGVIGLSVMDHYFQLEYFGPATAPMLEGYTTLAFVAARTSRLRLGLLVSGVTYRHPGLLAKTVTTLDLLSEGRAQLGIGAAWYEREHVGLGVPYPPLSERYERLEEAIQICLQMWSDDDGPYEGKHYQLAETICVPQPLSTPRPPILIGGSGERKTLRLVARYADACNFAADDVQALTQKLDVLRRHCEAEERDVAAIRPTLMATDDPLAAPDAFLAKMEAFAALGMDEVVVMPFGDPVDYTGRLCDKLVPQLAELGPGV